MASRGKRRRKNRPGRDRGRAPKGAEMPEEFIVRDHYRGRFIAGIDRHDGEMSDTDDPFHAQIYRGPEWHEYWTGPGWPPDRFRLDPPPEVERCPKDIES
jgi:hypothetical protein